MPISNGTFTYSNAGATNAASGQIVQSAVWNAVHSDIQTALGQLASNNYAGVASNRNIMCDNGSFEIWQRGLSVSVAASTTAYTADRWYLITNAGQASTVVRSVPLSNKSQFGGTVQRNAGQTGTGTYFLGYPLKIDEVVRIRNSKVYLSFLLNAGADFSGAGVSVFYNFYVGSGFPVKRGTGGAYTNELNVISGSVVLTPGVTKVVEVSSAGVIPVNSQQGELQLTWATTGTAGANDSLNIDDVQIQIIPASGVVQFTEYDAIPFPEMMRNCRRFYNTTYQYGVTPAQGAGLGNSLAVMTSAASRFGYMWLFPDDMQSATPTITTYNPSGASANWQDVTGGVSLAVTVDTVNNRGTKGVMIYGATAAAADRLIYIHAAADASI